MKTILNKILIFSLIFTTFSCENYLDEVPKSFASPSNFYKNSTDANAAVIAAYDTMQDFSFYFHALWITTDVTKVAPFRTQGGMANYTFNGDNVEFVQNIWEGAYRGINTANSAINNVPRVDMNETEKARLIAEATYIRAIYYFRLVRLFANVPLLLTETSSLAQEELEVEQATTEQVYEQIIKDLNFCIANLPLRGKTETGRATQGAAQTALSKVYLTMGSMEKRDGLGSGSGHFTQAANLAQDVINSGLYNLVPYYPDAFLPTNKNNNEIIFDVAFTSEPVDDNPGSVGQNMGLMGNSSFGGSFPNVQATQFYHTMFDDTDLVRRQWSAPHHRVVGPGNLRTNFPEMNGQPWKIGKFRAFPVKDPNYNPDFRPTHWPVFRYAEVLLIRAEALVEINNGPNAEVFMLLNQLRERARNRNEGEIEVWEDILPRNLYADDTILPDISAADYPDYTAIMDYIMDERAIELGGEFKRWFDLVRWGTLIERLELLGTVIPEPRTAIESDWEEIMGNISSRHFLMPIPNADIRANPKLKQNPGY